METKELLCSRFDIDERNISREQVLEMLQKELACYANTEMFDTVRISVLVKAAYNDSCAPQ
jgi:hypothetical protein